MNRHPHMPSPRRPAARLGILGPSAVLGITILVFSGAVRGHFVQDDFGWLLYSRFETLPQFLQSFARFNPWGSYRPLSQDTYFWLGQKVFGLWAPGYHAVSLFSHLAAALLVYALLRRFFAPLASLAGTLFFAVHSSHVWSLFWISAIPESMALVFSLASLLLFVRFDRQGGLGALALSVMAMGLGLMSKESILSLPLILLAYCCVFNPRRWVWTLPYFGLTGAYSLARFASKSVSAAPYALTLGRETWNAALGYLTWTAGLSDALLKNRLGPDPGAWYLPFGLLSGAAVAVLALMSRNRRVAVLGILWYVIALQPVLYFSQHTSPYYLAPALAGLALLVGAAAERLADLRGRRRLVAGGSAALIWISLSYAGVKLDGDWWNQRAESRHEVMLRIVEIDKRVPEGQAAYVFGLSPDQFGAFENGSALRLYGVSPSKLNFVLPPADAELRSRVEDARRNGRISSIRCFVLAPEGILDKSAEFRLNPDSFLLEPSVSYKDLAGVRLLITPQEVVRGKDTLRLKVVGFDARAIDVLYTIDGQPMPAVISWLLDAEQATSVFVDVSTRPGKYRFKALRDSSHSDMRDWIKVDAEVLVR